MTNVPTLWAVLINPHDTDWPDVVYVGTDWQGAGTVMLALKERGIPASMQAVVTPDEAIDFDPED